MHAVALYIILIGGRYHIVSMEQYMEQYQIFRVTMLRIHFLRDIFILIYIYHKMNHKIHIIKLMICHIFNTILTYSKTLTYIKEYSSRIYSNDNYYFLLYTYSGCMHHFNHTMYMKQYQICQAAM